MWAQVLLIATILLPSLGLKDIALTTDIAGIRYLDGDDWELRCHGNSCRQEVREWQLNARVPGDLISDLERNGVVGDPLFELNFREEADMWSNGNWTYSKRFETQGEADYFLVMEGIKMGAVIRIDGVAVQTATNQFLRYVLPLRLKNRPGPHLLSISFEDSIEEDGRFMACSGGWDWAPFTRTKKGGEAFTMTRGIWKSIYLAPTDNGVAILHAVPQIIPRVEIPPSNVILPFCEGSRIGLQENCDMSWKFDVSILVTLLSMNDAETSVSLSVSTSWGSTFSQRYRGPKNIIALPNAETTVELSPSPSAKQPNSTLVRLWWPHGLGEQNLYNITVCMESNTEFSNLTSPEACTTRSVGFRSVALVSGQDTDPKYVETAKNAEGNSRHGMYFRINGRIIYARGSNVIPPDEMEGRYDSRVFNKLVENAVLANFNLVRVWGGGVFLPTTFYEACDRLGLLISHDMMYAQRGHGPKRTESQRKEILHQVSRLSHHASIAVWNGCNECVVIPHTPSGIYASFVMATVISVDISRPIWPSCPSSGWDLGVHRLTSLPLSRNANLVPHVKHLLQRPIEVHGPYLHGTGFPAVNGKTKLQPLKVNVPPKFAFHRILPIEHFGPQFPNQFVSEFGSVVMSSFESMASTLKKEHYSLHGGDKWDQCNNNIYANVCSGTNAMAERNYPCDNLIFGLFGGMVNLDAVGETSFRAQLYLCQIAQALYMKSVIEEKRSKNIFGTMTWQLNEIWPTGGWGSLEYGSDRPGQTIGGRWKPLHYWFRDILYKDTFAACGQKDWCFVKHDSSLPLDGDLRMVVHDLYVGDEAFKKVFDSNVSVQNSFTVVPVWVPAEEGGFLILRAVTIKNSRTDEVLLHNISPMSLSALALVRSLDPTDFQAEVAEELNADGSVDINLSSESPFVWYVHFTTLAQGRFSENAFLYIGGKGRSVCLAQHPRSRDCHVVRFVPHNFEGIDSDENIALLRSSLRVEHLANALSVTQPEESNKSMQ